MWLEWSKGKGGKISKKLCQRGRRTSSDVLLHLGKEIEHMGGISECCVKKWFWSIKCLDYFNILVTSVHTTILYIAFNGTFFKTFIFISLLYPLLNKISDLVSWCNRTFIVCVKYRVFYSCPQVNFQTCFLLHSLIPSLTELHSSEYLLWLHAFVLESPPLISSTSLKPSISSMKLFLLLQRSLNYSNLLLAFYRYDTHIFFFL